MYKYIYFGTRT